LETSAQLLSQLETTFRTAARYSVTTSLSRALLGAHTRLLQENRLSLPQDRHYVSAVVAAARSDGLYVARAGPAIVAKTSGGRWIELGDRGLRPPGNGALELGADGTPTIMTEFYGLDPSEIVLMIPGVSYLDVSSGELLDQSEGIDLAYLSEILEDSLAGGSGLAVLRPQQETEEVEAGWASWGTPAPIAQEPEEVAPGVPDSPAAARTQPVDSRENTLPPPTREPTPARPRETGAPSAARGIGLARWTRVLPLVALAIVLGFAVLLLRGGLPQPGERDRSIAEAGRMILDAQATQDQAAATALLSQAIATLEPQANRDEGARALLGDARQTRDRVLNITRVSRINRIPLPTRDDFRPAGLWKGNGTLFLLDLGGQGVYRIDNVSGQLTSVLQPGETFDGQPVGRAVTAAWSPPRGTNTEGQLMVLDHTRSLIGINQDGALLRRWLPPDNGQWQRIGPSAATYENLFLLDTARAEVWRYPVRVPGAVGAIVARASEEPRIGAAVDLATDGNLYLLLPGGGISKVAPGGGKLPFDGVVPDNRLAAPTALFAQEGLDHIWVLEPGQARVVELTSGGSYVRQYVLPADAIRNGMNLHVDPAASELRVLTPQGVILIQTE
jgi:sugar lactone lactonase YvrE